MRVLLIDDAKDLVPALEREGLLVQATDWRNADREVRKADCDIIVMNLDLPAKRLPLLQAWRRDGVKPFLFVQAPAGTEAAVLDAGADGCMTRPIDMAELLARLRALMRRCPDRCDQYVVRQFDLEIHPAARLVKRAGKSIALTRLEYALLECLMQRQGKAMTRSLIWEHLYDEHDVKASNIIDVYISNIRKKIDRGFDFPLILTVRRKGYMFRAAPKRVEVPTGPTRHHNGTLQEVGV